MDNRRKTTFVYKLFNAQGELEGEIVSDKREIRLDTSGLPKGFYYLNIVTGEGIIRKSIVVEK